MRPSRLAVLSALLVGLVAAATPALSARPGGMSCAGGGRVRTCVVPLPAGVKVRSSSIRVVVPAGYDRSRRAYPVVYVLHGVGDDFTTWSKPENGDLERLTRSCQAIFVMPDGGSGKEAGWYSDWKDGTHQYETFHTAVLPRAVDATFRTQGPRRRAVAGLSMGGFGALSYSARHPSLYAATAAYSAFADSTFLAPASGRFYDVGGQNPVSSLGTPSPRVWGDQAADRATWEAHNPYDLAQRLRGRPLYLSSGHGAPGGSQGDDPSKGPNYLIEAYIGHLNDRLAERLTSLGIRFADARETGGAHDWPYWRANFARSLGVLMPALGAATPGCGR